MRKLATLIALVALTSVASAAVGTIVNDYSSFTGYTVNTISVDFGTEEWISCELIVLPGETGKIYQESYSYENPVPPFIPPIVTVDPWTSDQLEVTMLYYEMEYDSRIACGAFFGDTGAADIGKEAAPASETMYIPTVTDGTDLIRITWWTQTIVETGDLDLAMVTIDNTYTGGSWSFTAYDENSPEVPVYAESGTIVNGALIPEPATMLMLIGGGLGVFMRRRK